MRPAPLRTLLAVTVGLCVSACAGGSGRPRPPPMPSGAYTPGARAGVDRIDLEIRRYAREHGGRLPASLEDLARERAPDGTPYLREPPRDPWGAPYDYAVLSPRLGAYDLRSSGPDRLPGTSDDVVSTSGPVEIR